MDLNQFTFTGNIGQNARVNEVNGKRSINFSVAYNEKYKDNEGNSTERTLWINCSYWKNADQSTEIAKYLLAGTKVFVQGKADVKLYKNKDGQHSVSLNCIVNMINLLSPKKENDSTQEQETNTDNTGHIKPRHGAAPAGPDDDDMPF